MELTNTTRENIRQKALQLGFDDCKFTSSESPASYTHYLRWIQNGYHAEMSWIASERHLLRRQNPENILPGVKTIICLAKNYNTPAPPPDSVAAHIARYARIPDYHKTLRTPLKQLTDYLSQIDPNADCKSIAYADTGAILERDLAQRAGLGFVGKHTALIHPRLGTWFFLAEILTTLQIQPDTPSTLQNTCKNCNLCLQACPTGALNAPYQLDARRCLSYLTIEHHGEIPNELLPLTQERFFGCDRCLEACPHNRDTETLPQDQCVPAFLHQTVADFHALLASQKPEQTRQTLAGTALLRKFPTRPAPSAS